MKKVLVITCKDDVHCDFVAKEIQNSGNNIIRLNTDNIIENFNYEITNLGTTNFELTGNILDSNIDFTIDSYDTVWFRKPQAVEIKPNDIDPTVVKLLNSEMNVFIKEFYNINLNKRWVNSTWANQKASCKLAGLTVAKKIGFRVPDTIVTNNPLSAEMFAKKCNWSILTKPFLGRAFNMQDKIYHSYSVKVSKHEFYELKDRIKNCTSIFQEYIEKKLELRVTVIGNEIFTAAIYSQEDERTLYDCRAIDAYNLKHIEYLLPEHIKRKVLEFNRHYELNFSTFDIILTPENEYVFLECNPNGQWLWIEDLTGMPLSKTMADFLLKG